MVHRFRIHGLVLETPFPCEGLDPAPPGAAADVRVIAGDVPEVLGEPVVHEDGFDAAPDVFLLRGGPRSARFLVESGNRITFDRAPECEAPLFHHHLMYQAMAALLRQRGMLVCHASAALSPAGAVIVAGESGAGKSTTVAGLTSLGWPLQTDDVCALRSADRGGVEVLPGASRVHLNRVSADALQLSTNGLTPHPWHRMKMAMSVPVPIERMPAPVCTLVMLRGGGDTVRVERVIGHAKIKILVGALYGPVFPAEIARQGATITRALQTIEMLLVTRPDDGWTLDTVITGITGI